MNPDVNLTFDQAFEQAKAGRGMRLPQWSPDVVIRVPRPDELYVESRFGKVPWIETLIELFSEEWETVD